MPRYSPLRTVVLIVIWLGGSWLSLALLYAFIPSFPQTDLQTNQRISDGAKITRVYQTDKYYSYNDEKQNQVVTGPNSRRFFAVDYQLNYDPDAKTSTLHIGNASIDLHQYWSRIADSGKTEEGVPAYISDPIEVDVRLGDLDGINLPSFEAADAMLLFWHIHRDNINIPIRVQAYSSKMQIWPDAEIWDAQDHPPVSLNEPLLEITNVYQFNGTRVNARVPVKETHMNAMSPSRTFIIRKNLQRVLVPTGLLVYNCFNIVSNIVEVIFEIIWAILYLIVQMWTFYTVVVLIAWALSGRPKFGPWAQSNPLTRWVFAKVTSAQQHWPSHEEHNSHVSRDDRQPHPLRGPLDFFRSKSPMDDFLVTFDCTKRFLRPISFGAAAVLDDGSQVSMPNDIKLNISHRISKPGRTQRKETDWRDVERADS